MLLSRFIYHIGRFLFSPDTLVTILFLTVCVKKFHILHIISGHILITLSIIVFSIIQYEFVEKFFRKCSALFCASLVLTYIIGIWSLTSVTYPAQYNKFLIAGPEPISIEQAIELNEQLYRRCLSFPIPCNKDRVIDEVLSELPPDDSLQGKCVVNVRIQKHCTLSLKSFQLNEGGNLTAVFMGNSYVSRHINVVLEALNASNFGNKFAKVYIISRESCPSFDSTLENHYSNWKCPLGKGLMFKFLERVKPDLLILLNRLDHVSGFDRKATSLENDILTKKLTDDLVKMANLSKKVIIIQDHYVNIYYNSTIPHALSHVLATNQHLPRSTMKKKDTEESLINAWSRMKEASNHCPNCYTMETEGIYCDQKTCEAYDRKNNLAYFCDAYHFTEYATMKILPALRGKLNEVMSKAL